MHERRTRRITLWAGLAILAILCYPLSFFPACWVCTRLDGWRLRPIAERCLTEAYAPLIVALSESPDDVQAFVAAMIEFGAARDTEVWFIYKPHSRGLVWSRPGYTLTLLSYHTGSAR